MPQEIERKYLVKGNYKHLATTHTHIQQGYLCRDTERSVRIRITTHTAFLTIKGKSTQNGLNRYEWEKEIPISEAKDLFTLCQTGTIEKIRYYIPYQGLTIEIDEFMGKHQGLVLAEVELPSLDTPFNPPLFLGQEVTGQKEYYNAYLSAMP